MIYSNYPFTLDVHGVVSQISFPVSLHDTARTLLISLTDGGKPYEMSDGCRAVIAAVKADGTRLLNDCIIVGNKVIRYDFTPQTSAAVGKVDCEVRLYGVDGNIIASPRFTIVVYEGLIDERILSEDEKTTIDSMISAEQERIAAEKEREEIARRAEAAADRIDESVRADDLYIRYSAYPDGRDYKEKWERGLNYIGVSVGIYEPKDASDYDWAVFAPNVYVGSGDMPPYADVQIDPSSDGGMIVQTTGDSEEAVMSQKAVTDALRNVNTETLRGSAQGEVVAIDDVSTSANGIAVKVASKNILPYPYIKGQGDGTANGLTFKVNEDGTVTVNGTATTETYFYVATKIGGLAYDDFLDIKSGTYAISGCPSGGGGSTWKLQFTYFTDAGVNRKWADDVGSGAIVTIDGAAPRMAVFIVIQSGVVCDNLTFKPMIEAGKVVTAHTPYIEDISTVEVKACGKNLCHNNTALLEEWTSPNSGARSYAYKIAVPNGSYTISAKQVDGTTPDGQDFIYAYTSGLAGNYVVVYADTTYKFTSLTITVTDGFIVIYNATTIGKTHGTLEKSIDLFSRFYVQIEQGTTATEIEPYKETLYTVDAEGRANVEPIYPTTTLTATEGAIIKAEYAMDINKAYDRLVNAIISLGGNV